VTETPQTPLILPGCPCRGCGAYRKRQTLYARRAAVADDSMEAAFLDAELEQDHIEQVPLKHQGPQGPK
jgi:hypothetical protein